MPRQKNKSIIPIIVTGEFSRKDEQAFRSALDLCIGAVVRSFNAMNGKNTAQYSIETPQMKLVTLETKE